jgi:hypothetical protein
MSGTFETSLHTLDYKTQQASKGTEARSERRH